jgi:hypothetical protein
MIFIPSHKPKHGAACGAISLGSRKVPADSASRRRRLAGDPSDDCHPIRPACRRPCGRPGLGRGLRLVELIGTHVCAKGISATSLGNGRLRLRFLTVAPQIIPSLIEQWPRAAGTLNEAAGLDGPQPHFRLIPPLTGVAASQITSSMARMLRAADGFGL